MSKRQKIVATAAVVVAAACLLFAGSYSHRDRAHQVSPRNLRAYEVSLADMGDRIAVAWNGGEGDNNAIYLRLVDPQGEPTGDAMHLTDDAQDAFEPDLQALDGELLIVWYEKSRTDKSLTAFIARFDATGHPVWKRDLSSVGGNGRNPVARIRDHEIWVSWIETRAGEQPSVWCERFDAKGNVLSAAKSIAPASNETWNLNAAIDDRGRFYVVYDAQVATRASELQLVAISDDGVTQRTLSADDGFGSKYPDIAFNGARAALTWLDYRDGNAQVYLAVDFIDALNGPLDSKSTRVTETPGDSMGAYLAWNGDRIGLAWSGSIDGQGEIFLQHFDATGVKLDKATRLTHTETQSLIPAIRPFRNGFALGWNEYEPGTSGPSSHPTTNSSVAMVKFAD